MTTHRQNEARALLGASCGGCEISVLDIDEKILDLLEVAEVVFWPVAMDVKYEDVESFPDGYMDLCLFNGAIRTEEQEELAKLLRRKSKTMIAFGSCAHLGGIPGLANTSDSEGIFQTVYLDSPSTPNPENHVPRTEVEVEEGVLTLPKFHDAVKALNQVVRVDYYVPGCPPSTKLIEDAIEVIVTRNPPSIGSVLAPMRSVCDECPRPKEEKKIPRLRRITEFEPCPDDCLLDQGIICMGPATRGGCEARCISANMPCTGCGGPCPQALEQGSAMISALSTVVGLPCENERHHPESLVQQLKDPLGIFYKYGLPASLLNRKVRRR